jgi:aspartyl protease family protein
MKTIIYGFIVLIFSLLFIDCNGCSRSGRDNSRNSTKESRESSPSNRTDKITIKMSKESGVYTVPVEINGSNMQFIFDTGASDITISEVEAIFLLKQGTLSEEDIIGTKYYQIADGSISEGTKINLKTVKIGNKILSNVKASVIHNSQAPLLLGQSALAQFGKVSIDYNKNEIVFE